MMVIHVKDADTDELVRRLAVTRGIGITSAIREAVEEALLRDSKNKTGSESDTDEKIRTMLERWDRLPNSDVKIDKKFFDDLWGD